MFLLSSLSIVNFEHVNAGWEVNALGVIAAMFDKNYRDFRHSSLVRFSDVYITTNILFKKVN